MSTLSEEQLYVDYFENVSKHTQIDVCSHLFEAFLDEFIEDEIYSVQECIERITELYTGDNFFLVFFNSEKELVGMGSCDMTQFQYTPCIGNLCVVPKFRGRGYAEDIVDFIIKYIQHKTDRKIVYLWCHPFLKTYYSKRGWIEYCKEEEGQKDKIIHIMQRDVR